MNLNSIQQQAKKKKGVDTAAESSSTPMGRPFLKEKFAKWKIRPVRQASAHSCERQPRANLRGMVKMRAARMNLNVFNLQTKRNFQQSEIFFSIVLQLHSHILNWHELYYSSIFTLRSLLKYKLAASCFSISSVVLRNPWKEHVDLVLSTGRL